MRRSHLNSAGKLRWHFERTRHISNWSVAFALSPRLTETGPYADETHGFCASIRFLGFDPRAPLHASRAKLAEYGFEPAEAIVAHPRDGMSLVVVDTSGLHYRWAAVRLSILRPLGFTHHHTSASASRASAGPANQEAPNRDLLANAGATRHPGPCVSRVACAALALTDATVVCRSRIRFGARKRFRADAKMVARAATPTGIYGV